MFSQLNSFSFLEVSNSEMLLSEKDLEFNFLVRSSSLEFQNECNIIAPLQQVSDPESSESESEIQECCSKPQENPKIQDQDQENKCKFLISSLKIQIPTLQELKIQEKREEEKLDEECKTPTSVNNIIPAFLSCPPAPRKPKSLPSNKRKSPLARRRVLLDLSNEIESLFPPPIRADFGAKIKKVKQESN